MDMSGAGGLAAFDTPLSFVSRRQGLCIETSILCHHLQYVFHKSSYIGGRRNRVPDRS